MIATKEKATYKQIIEALEECNHGDFVSIKYNTVRNFDLNDEINNLSNRIKSMSVEDIYEGNKLKNEIKSFYSSNIKGEYKKEVYSVRKKDNKLEFNDASFLLFEDSNSNIKSVYIRNIIEITINGVQYVRK